MASLPRSIAVSVLFTLLGGPCLVLVLGPWWITHFRVPEQAPLIEVVVAWVLIAGGLFPLLESITRFVVVGRGTLMPAVPTERLVVSGLYRFVRNPMYVGNLIALSGEALLFRSTRMVVYVAGIWLAFHLFVLLYEEPRMARSFPEAYSRFQRSVPRWLPRLTPWKPVT